MKKRIILGFIILLFAGLFGVYAQENEAENINRALVCLDKRVNESSSLSLEEASFSALAGVPNKKVSDTIELQKSANDGCWPKAGCKIKETSQAILAYKKLGNNTDKSIDWLYTKNGTTNELRWYLQITIDKNEQAQCSIFYGDSERTISIGQDMKLNGDAGSCLEISPSGYWLIIKPDCVDKEYVVSCDKDFKTNFLYEKDSGGTIYVSAKTSGSAAKGRTNQKISAKCFKEGSSCDYEASLWATTALYAQGKKIDIYIPYLLAFASDNEKFFPSAFLRHIIGGRKGLEHYTDILQSRKLGGFWEMPNTPYNKYYDTSLGLIGLGGGKASGAEDSLSYLFDQQLESGCWNSNNIRDTAFIIYSARWLRASEQGDDGDDEVPGPKPIDDNPPNVSDGNISGGDVSDIYDPTILTDCQIEGYYCAPNLVACLDSGGDVLPEDRYACASFAEKCCTKEVVEISNSCAELVGQVCRSNEKCSIGTVSSSDGECCLGACELEEKESEPGEGSGGDGEQTKSSGNLRIIIIVLIILIILVLVGIVFRNKIRVWWFKFRGKAKSSPMQRPPPGGPPLLGSPRALPGSFSPRIFQPARRAPVTRPAGRAISEREKEMEETLKKLKKISG